MHGRKILPAVFVDCKLTVIVVGLRLVVSVCLLDSLYCWQFFFLKFKLKLTFGNSSQPNQRHQEH